MASIGEQEELWAQGGIAISTMHVSRLTDPTKEIPTAGYEYGVLPFPSLDGKSVFGQFERNIEAIFITSFSNHPEASARVLNEIYEPFEGYETMDVLKEHYNNSIFFDERDTEIVFKLAESLTVLPKSERAGNINYNISSDLKGSEVSTVLEKYTGQIQTVLEEEFISVKETMEKLFPGYND